MKRGIASALIIAVVLIGGASWYRFAGSSSVSSGLVTVDNQPMSEAQYEELLATFLNTDDSTANTDPLTATDLIGRQMIMDYVGMAREGELTADSLNLLADRYVESLPTLIGAEKAYFTDIKVVANSKENFQAYSSAMKEIYEAYGTKLFSQYTNRDVLAETDSNEMYTKMAAVYTETAQKLKSLSVPNDVAQTHLELINIYLSNASAIASVSLIETDSARSFAGVITVSDNLQKEQQYLDEIEKVVNRHGII